MLNDRQIAALLWVGIVLVALLIWPTGRRSLVDLARSFLSRKIWPIFALLALWSLGLVLIGQRTGIWTDALVVDTGFWFFTTAVVLLFNFSKASKEPDFFRRTAKEAFGLTLILGFLSDLYVLSLLVEFIGQGIIALLAAVSAIAAHQQDLAVARKLVDRCLGLVGLTIVSLGLIGLAASWSNAEAPDLARKLLMPAWMTIGFSPTSTRWRSTPLTSWHSSGSAFAAPTHSGSDSGQRPQLPCASTVRPRSWTSSLSTGQRGPLRRVRSVRHSLSSMSSRRIWSGASARSRTRPNGSFITRALTASTTKAGDWIDVSSRDDESPALDRHLPNGLGSTRNGLSSRHPDGRWRPRLARPTG
jgi:hypothetical protein